MWSFIKKMIAFRVGQKSARGAARLLGFGRLGLILGLVGGLRALKHHHRTT
jgi:hypothetical protein